MSLSRVTLVAHTHWDREWYEPFEVFRAQLVETLDEALDELERDPRLGFTLDGQVALVDDYLELRPRAASRITALVRAGRLHIGPFYTQADTLLADGESLIRNLAAGIRRAEELGGAMRVGYMPDQFGHAAQLPQILRMFGIEGAVLWRGVGPERPPHAFSWVAPDGSEVTTLWLQDGYGSGRRLPSDAEGFADAVERMLARLETWFGEVPVLIPVGDDHVRLAAWLPEAAAALRKRRPELTVTMGGYQDHLPHVGAVTHKICGELRSPAFAPVLAGVASARVREKQSAARATTLLLRYAEPLAAWLRVTSPKAALASQELLDRAWRFLFLNQAHDSAAGCGVDVVHEDVRARYRWAEQLGHAACARALARLRVEPPKGEPAFAVAFHPGPATTAALIEARVPRSLDGPLVSVGADGIARPVQSLGDPAAEQPLFEGEFSAAELGQYLGGLDPMTPLFGKYLAGIVVRDEGAGLYRLDVGLGDTPARAGALAEDQKRVAGLVGDAARFKVVLHSASPTRPVLAQAGPAPQAGFLKMAIRRGQPSAEAPRAGRLADGNGIVSGPISVVAEPDGTVIVRDQRLGIGPVRINDLVDEGDRGDLYHFDSSGAPVRPRCADISVVEAGPLRARLRIVHELDLPLGLDGERRGRARTTLLTRVTTDITLAAGERRVEVTTTLDNAVGDHRLRALIHAPFVATRVDVEHGMAVVSRALDTAQALGHGTEKAAPTGQHHGFVDITDGHFGIALMSPGLPEYEALPERDGTQLALTLLRAVGWLSRGDLAVIEHAAGPIVPTPGAQELGPHRFEYALVLHAGGWAEGGVFAEARRHAAPAIEVHPGGTHDAPVGVSLVEVTPKSVVLGAVHPAESGRGLIIRVVNASCDPADATIVPATPPHEVALVDPLERPLERPHRQSERARIVDGRIRLTLRPWEIATVLVQ